MNPILGIGTDIIEVERVRSALQRHGNRFVTRAFTEAEAGYCGTQADPAVHFAGRFAAKEAVLKALGVGWSGGVGWRDVEVLSDGAPRVRLLGRAADLARAQGVAEPVMISIAHVQSMAVAFALLQGTGGIDREKAKGKGI
ncbi:MAG: holo-ACP synthase [Planctomycetota bacterium]|jgi:holo-[acyl-carrier protein] synthase